MRLELSGCCVEPVVFATVVLSSHCAVLVVGLAGNGVNGDGGWVAGQWGRERERSRSRRSEGRIVSQVEARGERDRGQKLLLLHKRPA